MRKYKFKKTVDLRVKDPQELNGFRILNKKKRDQYI